MRKWLRLALVLLGQFLILSTAGFVMRGETLHLSAHPLWWLVGGSIFPGQSTAAVSLARLRVAVTVRREKGGPGAAVLTHSIWETNL